jgi:Ca2+-binding RTX toxin-like protein
MAHYDSIGTAYTTTRRPDPRIEAWIVWALGDGEDTVTYVASAQPVTVTLDGVANDGATGENDYVRADVEDVFGSPGDDTLTGNDGPNVIVGGFEGNDSLIGGGGHDDLSGRRGDDSIDADDGVSDRVVCGDGVDSATVDDKDHVAASCEAVTVSAS